MRRTEAHFRTKAVKPFLTSFFPFIPISGSILYMFLSDSKLNVFNSCILKINPTVVFIIFFQVYIEVLNENDNVPLSEKTVYYPTIPEESPEGRSVLQIHATDEDKDPNQKITYKIISGNPEGFFSINSATGR